MVLNPWNSLQGTRDFSLCLVSICTNSSRDYGIQFWPMPIQPLVETVPIPTDPNAPGRVYRAERWRLCEMRRPLLSWRMSGKPSWGSQTDFRKIVDIYTVLSGLDILDAPKYWVKVVTYAAVIFLCRKRCAVGTPMIYMSFLLDESIVCGIDFSNTLQGHTCFWDIFFLR